MWALRLLHSGTRVSRGVTAQETQEWGLAGMKCGHDSFVIAASALIATGQIPLYSQESLTKCLGISKTHNKCMGCQCMTEFNH
jgi:hypothetical protein